MTTAPELTSQQHFDAFAEFVELELASGGPDPHMRYVGWMSQNQDLEERIWRGGVYMAVYNTPTAEAIWSNWPWERVREEYPDLGPWISENWKGLTTRRERRAVRSPEKLTRCLLSFQQFAASVPERFADLRDENPSLAFEYLWPVSTGIYGYGRYAGFKILEFLRRYCEAPLATPDIRPEGGWSPRETLAMLYPERASQIAPHKDSYDAVAASNAGVERLHGELIKNYDLNLDNYLLEVLLCNYRQEVLTRWQYPGRSHDMELVHMQTVQAHFGKSYPTQFWAAREALVPWQHRGEVGDRWDYERKELGSAFVMNGYTWTDLRHDFEHTTDLARPALHSNPVNTHDYALTQLAAAW